MESLAAIKSRPLRGGVDRNTETKGWGIVGGMSPPSRGRGSKLEHGGRRRGERRRPLRGAWIETTPSRRSRWSGPSPPSRGRGSKRVGGRVGIVLACRPLRGGVDRNRPRLCAMPMACRSPPSRGRGSKHPPVQDDPEPKVAPFAGAWIETRSITRRRHPRKGRPLRGGVDRNGTILNMTPANEVAPFAGAWIETARHSRT